MRDIRVKNSPALRKLLKRDRRLYDIKTLAYPVLLFRVEESLIVGCEAQHLRVRPYYPLVSEYYFLKALGIEPPKGIKTKWTAELLERLENETSVMWDPGQKPTEYAPHDFREIGWYWGSFDNELYTGANTEEIETSNEEFLEIVKSKMPKEQPKKLQLSEVYTDSNRSILEQLEEHTTIRRRPKEKYKGPHIRLTVQGLVVHGEYSNSNRVARIRVSNEEFLEMAIAEFPKEKPVEEIKLVDFQGFSSLLLDLKVYLKTQSTDDEILLIL